MKEMKNYGSAIFPKSASASGVFGASAEASADAMMSFQMIGQSHS
jgi:hypothetical protein